MTRENDNASATLVLSDLTIYSAAENKEKILKEICNDKKVILDLSQVEEIDSAGLQLLILAKREANLRHTQLEMTDHSKVVIQTIDACSLSSFFGDPMVFNTEASVKESGS